MMFRIRSFALIEFMIYMVLIVLMIFWFDQLRIHVITYTIDSLTRITYHQRLLIALDLINKDIVQSPSQCDQWEKMQTDAILWKKDGSIIGWIYKNKNLYRAVKNKSDRLMHYTLVLKNIDHFSCDLSINHNMVHSLYIKIIYHSLELQRYIYPTPSIIYV